jgi:glucosamine 6-phosphate synthetase-like amidotransferase/phosphosugar isomerase protein
VAREVANFIFSRSQPFNLNPAAMSLFNEITQEYDFFEKAYRNYPLIYVTGPDERDVNLTISQINTHKIRGADTFVIAEENEKLLDNARTNPHDKGYYGWGYIMLPKTGDSLLTAFTSTIVLQLLSLRMSVRKMKYLDRLGIVDHGVHPDVPKNVSKSITVD